MLKILYWLCSASKNKVQTLWPNFQNPLQVVSKLLIQHLFLILPHMSSPGNQVTVVPVQVIPHHLCFSSHHASYIKLSPFPSQQIVECLL